MHNKPKLIVYPVNADVAISIISLAPIRCAFWLKIGLTVCTPIQSGISCLFASTNNGTPDKCSEAIILSEKSTKKRNLKKQIRVVLGWCEDQACFNKSIKTFFVYQPNHKR